jgi:cystathionine beta-lyase
MPNGFGPVFGLVMKSEKCAKWLQSKLRIFQHATSLGGMESLIEWRKMSDHSAEGDVLRVSVDIETLDDLQKDLSNGFKAIMENATID